MMSLPVMDSIPPGWHSLKMAPPKVGVPHRCALTVNKRVVRILLAYFLVTYIYMYVRGATVTSNYKCGALI